MELENYLDNDISDIGYYNTELKQSGSPFVNFRIVTCLVHQDPDVLPCQDEFVHDTGKLSCSPSISRYKFNIYLFSRVMKKS